MKQVILFDGPGEPLRRKLFDPAPLGFREIRVDVVCTTLCRSDLSTYTGKRTEPTPCVLGHEITGQITEFGPDSALMDARGQALAIGDRISWAVAASCGDCFYCRRELPQKCVELFKYGHRQIGELDQPTGGLAESLTLVEGTAVYRVPDSLPTPVATMANCATATVSAILRQVPDVASSNVLVIGAGVLGLTAAAMCRDGGAAAIVVLDPVSEQRELATRFGASSTVTLEHLPEEVARITGDQGFDLIVELSGRLVSVELALSQVRIGGTVALAGTVSPVGNLSLDPEMIVRRCLTLVGVHNYHPDDLGIALNFLAESHERYPFAELVTGEFTLAETDLAFELASRTPGRRIAVFPNRKESQVEYSG